MYVEKYMLTYVKLPLTCGQHVYHIIMDYMFIMDCSKVLREALHTNASRSHVRATAESAVSPKQV
jgi:hypothetical protein